VIVPVEGSVELDARGLAPEPAQPNIGRIIPLAAKVAGAHHVPADLKGDNHSSVSHAAI
jgi:hypothetical protein